MSAGPEMGTARRAGQCRCDRRGRPASGRRPGGATARDFLEASLASWPADLQLIDERVDDDSAQKALIAQSRVVGMTESLVPRVVKSVLVEAANDSVVVTWGLGEPVTESPVEYFGYGVDYFGVDGNGGKRFGVRFHEKTSAYVFEWSSATQANYEADAVTVGSGVLVVRYNDASIGLTEVGEIHAFSHVNGDDSQLDLPVTLLR